jgi:hypothetical protein
LLLNEDKKRGLMTKSPPLSADERVKIINHFLRGRSAVCVEIEERPRTLDSGFTAVGKLVNVVLDPIRNRFALLISHSLIPAQADDGTCKSIVLHLDGSLDHVAYVKENVIEIANPKDSEEAARLIHESTDDFLCKMRERGQITASRGSISL